jgi:hypothetical protein
MLAALAVLAVLFASGSPIAYCLTRDHGEWVRFVFESLAIGLLAQIAIGIVALRSHHYSLGLLGAMTLALVAAGAVVAWRRGIRGWPRLDLPLMALAGVLVAAALLLRRHPSYFAFSVGDMGGYVNGANALAAGRQFGNRPQGFTVFLAGTNALLGAARTVSGLPAIGIVLLLGTMSLGKLIGLRTTAVAIVGAIVVVHPLTVWFSLFPVSEVPYAVLLIAALYFLVRARSDGSGAYAVVSGLCVGSMMFVRINVLLLVPILVVVLLASAVADDDVRYRVQRTVTLVALALVSLGYVYDVRYAEQYMTRQLRGKVIPDFAFDAATRWNLIDVSPALVLALVALFAAVLLAAFFVRGSRAPRIPPPASSFWRAATATVVGLAVVTLALSQKGGVADTLARWGPALLVLAAAGIGVIVIRPGRYLDGAAGLFVVLTAVAYTILFAFRLRHARGAIYFLYWDRYSYSEVLPLALLLVAIALHVLLGACVDATNRRPAWRVATAVGLVALLGLAIIPPALQTRHSGIAEQALYGDVYGKLSELDRLARTEGKAPIVYSGVQPAPPGWFFPNTKSAIAQPLQASFGRVVVALGFRRDTLDRVFTPRHALMALSAAGSRKGYLISLRPAFTNRYPDDAHTRYVGSVDYAVPILRRSLDRWSERFSTVDLRFDVYALHQ